MNDSTSVLPTPLPPQRLLLATDLCAGCDRPLDRAKQLAREWQAELAVLTVRDGPQTPEEVASWLDGSPTVHAFELAARRELAEEFSGTGVTPTLQVLEGDVTDSIPGVSKIGLKTGAKLLRAYGNIDAVMAGAGILPGALGESLRKEREILYLSRKLVELKTDVILGVTWNKLAWEK